MVVAGETDVRTFEGTTVTIIRVGATKKYSDGWQSAFGKGKKQAEPAPAAKKATKKAAKKATASKTATASAKKKSPGKKAKKK